MRVLRGDNALTISYLEKGHETCVYLWGAETVAGATPRVMRGSTDVRLSFHYLRGETDW